MLRPDFWFQVVLRAARASFEHKRSPYSRYLHILLASLAVGGLTMAWRSRWSKRDPEVDRGRSRAPFPPGAGCFHFFGAGSGGGCSCSHCPRMCAAFFWEERAVTAALVLAVSGLCIALILARQGGLKLASAAAAQRHSGHGLRARGWCATQCFSPTAARRPPAPTALAMPHGQTAALSLFLVTTVLVVAVALPGWAASFSMP